MRVVGGTEYVLTAEGDPRLRVWLEWEQSGGAIACVLAREEEQEQEQEQSGR